MDATEARPIALTGIEGGHWPARNRKVMEFRRVAGLSSSTRKFYSGYIEAQTNIISTVVTGSTTDRPRWMPLSYPWSPCGECNGCHLHKHKRNVCCQSFNSIRTGPSIAVRL